MFADCFANVRTEKLRLAEQGNDLAQKQVLVMGNPHKSGPFGTVKSSRTNPTIVADVSVNPRLAKLLEKVGFRKELIVCLANSNSAYLLVFALDDDIPNFCELNHVPFYKRDPEKMSMKFPEQEIIMLFQ
ncbi:hypothetical protein MKW98_025448, partial [Papaver atlanticum]